MTYSNPDRPEMQLTDVGPIMNHAANEVFKSLPVPEYFDTPSLELPDLTDFDKFGLVIVACTKTFYNYQHEYARRESTLALRSVNGLFCRQTLQGGLTHYCSSAEVLSEGVKSGMIAPANAVLTKLAEQQQLGYGYTGDEELKIDFTDISKMLADRQFQNSLVRLAKAPNGTYGNSSVEPDKLGSGLLSQELQMDPIFDGLRLTAEVKEVLKDKLKQKKERTGGCPVARATYPELGSYATTYARTLGITPDELKNQRTSAIILGARYLAKVFASLDQVTMTLKD